MASPKEKDELPNEGGAGPSNPATATDAPPSSTIPVKRGRGRPKGSKNKTKSAVPTPDLPKRPRGRPRKNPPAEGSQPLPAKRPRGRPRKLKEPVEADEEGDAHGEDDDDEDEGGKEPKKARTE